MKGIFSHEYNFNTVKTSDHFSPLWTALLACAGESVLLLQVFLAGGGIFSSGSWWSMHEVFGMSISLLPLVFLLFSWIGRLGRRALWLSGLAFVLVMVQSLLIKLPGQIGLPILSALHPVNALIIFGLALWLTQHAWRVVRSDRQSRR